MNLHFPGILDRIMMKPNSMLLCVLILLSTFETQQLFGQERPNFLWITSEDNSPYLGCYGDKVARTPNIDALAQISTRYDNCFSNAAVCAPARQTLISGMYASSLGGQHMRSNAAFPVGVTFFPQYLRNAGYFTSNNNKTDYNGGPNETKAAMKAAWDMNNNSAHWKYRPDSKPFFSVFNIGDTHESRLFPNHWKNKSPKTDPTSVTVPPYLPDTPEIRLDIARYYDCIESMDTKVGTILNQLKSDNLLDNTIIFYFGDHGGSLPRGKSFIYDSGTRVPLLVHIPEKWAGWRETPPSSTTRRLVSFVDFAPTILNLIGADIPDYMQGIPFLGPNASSERQYVHTFRARRGERYDIVRGVRTQNFLYLRNYTPHLPVMQYNDYSFAIPGYVSWMVHATKNTNHPTSKWFAPKPQEELYDVRVDPDNVHNLAHNAAFIHELVKLRRINQNHILKYRDSVFYPESMQGREYSSFQNDEKYPLNALIALHDSGLAGEEGTPPNLVETLNHPNPVMQYWGLTHCVIRPEMAENHIKRMGDLLEDSDPVIQLQSARAIAGASPDKVAPELYEKVHQVLNEHLASNNQIHELLALLVMDECQLESIFPNLIPIIKETRGQYGKRVAEWILNKRIPLK